MNRFKKEIDEGIERLAKDNHCNKENLECMTVVRENGFTTITVDAFNKLNIHQKNKLIGKRRAGKKAAV